MSRFATGQRWSQPKAQIRSKRATSGTRTPARRRGSSQTGCLPPEFALDRDGYVLTGRDVGADSDWHLDRDRYLLETSVPGIFACGDVRSGPVKRVASAVGEGSLAIAFVHQYLRETGATVAEAVDATASTAAS